MVSMKVPVPISAGVAFVLAAGINYLLCILLLFRRRAQWNTIMELIMYLLVIISVGALDTGLTSLLVVKNMSLTSAKSISCIVALLFNFLGRRFLVFSEKSSGPWKPQES